MERIELKVCGLVLGTHLEWDDHDILLHGYHNFIAVIPGLPNGYIVVNYETGELIFENEEGEPIFSTTFLQLIKDNSNASEIRSPT